MSVDGTDCKIEKNGKRWFSHKFKKPGVRYEVAVGIASGDIVSIVGPFPCGDYPDIKIFRMVLKHDLDDGERVEADKGYQGDKKVKAPGPLYDFDERYVKMKKDVASRHETVNQRLKLYTCLVDRFRHGVEKHAACFRAVAVMTQIAIENGEPLFDVNYNDH